MDGITSDTRELRGARRIYIYIYIYVYGCVAFVSRLAV